MRSKYIEDAFENCGPVRQRYRKYVLNSKNKNRKNRGKAIFKKIIAENFPDLMKDMNLQIKETIPKVGKKEARKGGKERERERE